MNTVEIEKITNIRLQFDQLIHRHDNDIDFTQKITETLDSNSFPAIEELQEIYAKDSDMDRLLRIGIVGAVKAGKSSLLNALFFEGKDILPKAASPMTAALTHLEYGEKVSVTVNFFEEKDLKKLETDAKRYKDLLQKKTDENFQQEKNQKKESNRKSQSDSNLKTRAASRAEQDLKTNHSSLSASYDQYKKITQAPHSVREEIAAGSKVLPLSSLDEIKTVLSNYVGASGKYMPFTRDVEIQLPLDGLKEIDIVDTPGFNDPVPSRNNKARELLKKCDVVLILTRANQNLTNNDTDVLGSITTKNAITRLFLILSQFDNTLFGGEVVEEAENDLRKAVAHVKDQVTEHVKSVLRKDELNENGVFDAILENSKEHIFHSSGLCHSMFKTWNTKADWDSGRKTVWENLSKYYPDYFSDTDIETSKQSLKYLGNMQAMEESITAVKEKKEEIFTEKLASFEKKYTDNARKSKDEIAEYISNRIEKIGSLNLEKINTELNELNAFTKKIKAGLTDVFETCLDNWVDDVREANHQKLKELFKKAKGDASSAEGSDTEEWTTGWLWWKKHHTAEYTTVNIRRVQNAVEEFKDSFNSEIGFFFDKQQGILTSTIQRDIIKFWIANAPRHEEDRKHELRNSIRSIVYKSMPAKLEYTDKLPFSNNSRGILRKDEAEEFLARTMPNEMNEFKNSLSNVARGFIETTRNNLANSNFANKMLEEYAQKLEKKKKEAEGPKQAQENWKRIQKELNNIEF